MGISVVRFDRESKMDFVSELRKSVNDYFVDNDISKFGNVNMYWKTVFMLSVYFVPFVLMMTGILGSAWASMLVWSVMGLGMCGIGLSIMHDANHGAYSKNKYVNKVLGYLLDVIGTYHVTWKIQHNVLHHSSTNVHDYDEDLNNQLMRFSPNQPYRNHNKVPSVLCAIFLWLIVSL